LLHGCPFADWIADRMIGLFVLFVLCVAVEFDRWQVGFFVWWNAWRFWLFCRFACGLWFDLSALTDFRRRQLLFFGGVVVRVVVVVIVRFVRCRIWLLFLSDWFVRMLAHRMRF